MQRYKTTPRGEPRIATIASVSAANEHPPQQQAQPPATPTEAPVALAADTIAPPTPTVFAHGFMHRVMERLTEPLSSENVASVSAIAGGVLGFGAGVAAVAGEHHLAVLFTEAAGAANAISGAVDCKEHFKDRDEKLHVNEGLADLRAVSGVASGVAVAGLAATGFAPFAALADSLIKVVHHHQNGGSFHSLHPGVNPGGTEAAASMTASAFKMLGELVPGGELVAGVAEICEGLTTKAAGDDNVFDHTKDNHHHQQHRAEMLARAVSRVLDGPLQTDRVPERAPSHYERKANPATDNFAIFHQEALTGNHTINA